MSATARDGQAKASILDLHLGLPHGWQGDWYWSHHPLPSRCALIGIWNPEGTGREPSFCWSKKQSRTLIQDNVGCWCPKWHPNYYAKHLPPILAISELCSSYHQHTSMDLNQKLLLTLLRFFVRLTENRVHSVQSHFSHSYKVWCGRKIWIINVNRKLVHPVCKALIKLQPHQQSMWLLRPSVESVGGELILLPRFEEPVLHSWTPAGWPGAVTQPFVSASVKVKWFCLFFLPNRELALCRIDIFPISPYSNL